MKAKPFLDTNILIYAFASQDRRMPAALSLIEAGGSVSVQVLNEFVNVSLRKLSRPWGEIERQLTILRTLLDPPFSIDTVHHELAVRVAKRYGFGIFDSLMIASATTAQCDVFYTEDMQHEQRIEGLTIRNPFVI
jgi:predicted nucleic acid-binding protein